MGPRTLDTWGKGSAETIFINFQADLTMFKTLLNRDPPLIFNKWNMNYQENCKKKSSHSEWFLGCSTLVIEICRHWEVQVHLLKALWIAPTRLTARLLTRKAATIPTTTTAKTSRTNPRTHNINSKHKQDRSTCYHRHLYLVGTATKQELPIHACCQFNNTSSGSICMHPSKDRKFKTCVNDGRLMVDNC